MWTIEKIKSNSITSLTFINDVIDASVLKFELDQYRHLHVFRVVCTDTGRDALISKMPPDVELNFIKAANSSEWKCELVSNMYAMQHVLLAIDSIYHIAMADKNIIAEYFGFCNMHYNDRSAGRLAISLKGLFGMETALRYARKEIARTNGETSCMSDLVTLGTVKAKAAAYINENAVLSKNSSQALVIPEITSTSLVKEYASMIEEECEKNRNEYPTSSVYRARR